MAKHNIVISLVRNYTQDKNKAFAAHMDLDGPIAGITALIANEVVNTQEAGLGFGVLQSITVDLSTRKDGLVINQQDHEVILKFRLNTDSSVERLDERARAVLDAAQSQNLMAFQSYTISITDA